MYLRYSGNNAECNQLTIQLNAKLHKKDASKPQGLFAAPSEANAVIASFKDFCRNPLCCGKRKFAKQLYADCWRRVNKGTNNFRPHYDNSNSFGGDRNDLKTNQRGNNFAGKQFTSSTNMKNSRQNTARAGGKFNSMNSHKFQSQVCNVGGSGKFSKRGGNKYYRTSKPT